MDDRRAAKIIRRMEAEQRRAITGVHKWDYEHPTCLWESWPWWFRWPAAAAIAIYFGGGFLAGVILIMRNS